MARRVERPDTATEGTAEQTPPGTTAAEEAAAAQPAPPTATPPASPDPAARADLPDRPAWRVPPVLAHAAALSWRFLVVIAAAYALLWVLVRLRVIVIPVILALFLATLLTPLVDRLRRRGWPRLAAAWTVFGITLLVLAGIITLFVPLIAADLGEVSARAREGVQELQRYLAGPPFNLSAAELDRFIEQAREEIQANSQRITTGVVSGAVLAGEIVTGLIVALVVGFFLIKDSDVIGRWLLDFAGPRNREHLRAMTGRAAYAMSSYLRGVAIVGLFDAFFIGLGLVLLGVPLAFPLAFLTFVGAFLPLVGAFTAGALAALVTLVTQGLIPALVVVAITVAVQQLEGHVLAPVVYSRAVSLHPIVILLALGTGTVLGGIPGAFLSVPIAAVITAVGGYLRDREPPEMAEEAPTPGPEPASGQTP